MSRDKKRRMRNRNKQHYDADAYPPAQVNEKTDPNSNDMNDDNPGAVRNEFIYQNEKLSLCNC